MSLATAVLAAGAALFGTAGFAVVAAGFAALTAGAALTGGSALGTGALAVGLAAGLATGFTDVPDGAVFGTDLERVGDFLAEAAGAAAALAAAGLPGLLGLGVAGTGGREAGALVDFMVNG